MKYDIQIEAVISMHTSVEANSLAEAIETAKERSVMSLCHQCSNADSEREWVTSGELDFDPYFGTLTSVTTEDGEGDLVSEALPFWTESDDVDSGD